jgi:hypothetical protein
MPIRRFSITGYPALLLNYSAGTTRTMVNHYFRNISKKGGIAIGIIENALLYGK